MLKSIDILLGLSVVMLVTSMAVTVLTQFWTTLWNTRGLHLRDGLAELLRHIDPAFSDEMARRVMNALLSHPLIAEGGRLGTMVHREEFTRILLELASSGEYRGLSAATQSTLIAALRANGIPDPAGALSRVRQAALALEIASPEMAAGARHDLAILQAAGSDFVAKINTWFDQTVDRISARFTFTTRKVALMNALLLALALQLDAVALINHLASDDGLRGSLVQQAYAKDKLAAPDTGLDLNGIEKLASRNLLSTPDSPSQWLAAWGFVKIPGILLSTLLLSLGAPFWFETLKNLLRLRSAVAVKDDGQRQARQAPAAGIVDTAKLAPTTL